MANTASEGVNHIMSMLIYFSEFKGMSKYKIKYIK